MMRLLTLAHQPHLSRHSPCWRSASIAIAIYNVNVAVTAQAERELQRGLDEAGTLIDEYRAGAGRTLLRGEARLVADLPRFKAAVETNHPTDRAAHSPRSIAADRRRLSPRHRPAGRRSPKRNARRRERQLRGAAAHSTVGIDRPRDELVLAAPRRHPAGGQRAHLTIDPQQPEISWDAERGIQPRLRRGSSIPSTHQERYRLRPRRRDSARPTLAPSLWPVADAAARPRRVSGSTFRLATRSTSPKPSRLSLATPAARVWDHHKSRSSRPPPQVIVMRSRTERLAELLNPLHRTLVGHRARRRARRDASELRDCANRDSPTRRHHRDDERDGGALVTSPAESHAVARGIWEDEDARLLATTFNTMTDSIARFQREAAQRERLSVTGSPVDSRRARDSQSADDHQDSALRRFRTAQDTENELQHGSDRHRRRDGASESPRLRGPRLREAN